MMTAPLHTVGNFCDDMDCERCNYADWEATVLRNGGQAMLDRINSQMAVINGGKVASVKTFGKAPGTRSGRGIVRGMSDKQIKFATFLINSRDMTNMHMLKGWTLNINELHTISLAHARAFIDALLACPEKPAVHSVRIATDGQKRYIASLNAQAGSILTESYIRDLPFDKVNSILDMLKSKIKENATVRKEEITEGMYKVDTRIFKVQRSKESGYLYAKELIYKKFTYVSSAIRLVRSKGEPLSLEEAKAYGKRTGQCCVCGRELTNPESIEAGIGPVCAGRL